MRIRNFLENTNNGPNFNLISKNCHQFLEATQDPILKNLPCNYTDVHKTKVRMRKSSDTVSETFNDAFKAEHSKIFQRAIFANGLSSFVPSTSKEFEPFYIFPVDGYKFMYCNEVENSGIEYQRIFNLLFEQLGNDEEQTIETVVDLLKFTYRRDNLKEGIASGAEIILYNIPHYYAVKVGCVNEYNDILKNCITR